MGTVDWGLAGTLLDREEGGMEDEVVEEVVEEVR
jgi:hypothetical protein